MCARTLRCTYATSSRTIKTTKVWSYPCSRIVQTYVRVQRVVERTCAIAWLPFQSCVCRLLDLSQFAGVFCRWWRTFKKFSKFCPMAKLNVQGINTFLTSVVKICDRRRRKIRTVRSAMYGQSHAVPILASSRGWQMTVGHITVNALEWVRLQGDKM